MMMQDRKAVIVIQPAIPPSTTNSAADYLQGIIHIDNNVCRMKGRGREVYSFFYDN